MNLFAEIRQVVLVALAQMQEEGVLPEELVFGAVAVEPPRDPAHGDMATNAAMVLAKQAKRAPRDIAQALATKLQTEERIADIQVAGPGFLNMRLTDQAWFDVLGNALRNPDQFGRGQLGQGQRVNVEYVSANPTGPLHVGHTRGAVFGDALANLLAFSGYEVTREYYINDAGSQVDVLARSVYLRYLEAHGHEVSFPEGTYPADYLVTVGQALKAEDGDAFVDQPEDVWLETLRDFSIAAMLTLIRNDLADLGVHMDQFFSERSLYQTGKIDEAIDRLRELGLIYHGTLPPPKGKLPEDWEARAQTLFRSTDFGDDTDRPVQKSDGSWAYFAPDIAYHYDKILRGYDQLINIFGADHGGYVKRMKAAVAAMSDNKMPFDIKLMQLVKLFKNGMPFKMSKRAGNFVTLRDLLDQVGADATRFAMLTRKNDASLDFDFDKVLEQTRENPVFYVQYAHARICSVKRKAAAEGFSVEMSDISTQSFAHLRDDAEMDLLKKLAEWPRLVEIATKTHEPHRVAFYLYDLAGAFHSLWNKGNENPALRFYHEGNHATTCAKLALPSAVAVVISAGLGILGVRPMEEMR